MMTEKEERFTREILIDGNGAAAARRAGYAEKHAKTQANRLMKNPEIRKAIEEGFKELHMSAEEAAKRITDIGRTRLNDFFISRTVVKSQMVRKPLALIIQELELEWQIEQEYFEASELFNSSSTDDDDKNAQKELNARQDAHFMEQLMRKETILRHRIELKYNPSAYRDVPTAMEVQEIVPDLEQLWKEKERGTIKKISFNEKGMPNIEMYPADKAQEIILKLNGKLRDSKLDITSGGLNFMDLLKQVSTEGDDDEEEDDEDQTDDDDED